MNQRIRPMMPTEGNDKPQRGYHRRHWYTWNRHHPYYYRYYNWYDRFYDWDYYYRSNAPQRATPESMPPEMDNPQYLKIEPLLMAHLLDFSYKQIQSEEQVQLVIDKMLEISMDDSYLNMNHFDEITSVIVTPTVEEPKAN